VAPAGQPADDADAGVCAADDHTVKSTQIRLDFAVGVAGCYTHCADGLREGTGRRGFEVFDDVEAAQIVCPDGEAGGACAAAVVGVSCSFDDDADFLFACPF
jgi:hypothetical protein